tara:strand:+ start:908 stop:1213 length:306 start_codon:yes stop_codon:yes gene_type:complete
MAKVRRKTYTRAQSQSKYAPYQRDELDGLSLGQVIWWKDIDENIYTGEINQLVEHPEYGNWVSCYCINGGFRTKLTGDVSTKKIRRKRGRKPKKESIDGTV